MITKLPFYQYSYWDSWQSGVKFCVYKQFWPLRECFRRQQQSCCLLNDTRYLDMWFKKGTPDSKSLWWFLRVSYSFWARDSKFSPNMHFGSYRKPVGSIFQISTSKGDFWGETVFNWRRLLANLNRACSMSCSTFIFTPNQFFIK